MDEKGRYSLVRYSAGPGPRPVESGAAFAAELGQSVRGTDFWGRRGRYSLLRYSVNLAKKSVPASVAFSASLNAVAGPAVAVGASMRCSETMWGSFQGTAAVVCAIPASSGLFASIRMSADVVTSAAMSEALHAAVYGQKDIPALLGSIDVLAASVWGSKDVPAALPVAVRLVARAAGSKDVPARLLASEVLTSILEATSQTTQRTTLQLTIPPGGELRIDSGLFIVLLNGENALHTQSGDWIDVSRELLRLIVESASGGLLQGQLIYTERYL